MKRFSLFVLSLAVVFTACNKDDDNGPTREELEALRAEQAAEIESRLDSESLTYEVDEFGIYRVAVEENPDGASLQQGEIAEIYYTITDFEGNVIDENTSGDPTRMTYSQSQAYLPYLLYPSLTQMKVGDTYRFYTPFTFGYNDISVENKIDLREIVIMEIELVNIIPDNASLLAAEMEEFEAYLNDNSLEPTDTLSGSVIKVVQTAGTGDEPANGQLVSVDYAGSFLDGEEFDSGSLEVTIGNNGLIAGFSTALRSMREGESATVLIPSRQAYGNQPPNFLPYDELSSNPIPPHTPLVFEITVTSIQ